MISSTIIIISLILSITADKVVQVSAMLFHTWLVFILAPTIHNAFAQSNSPSPSVSQRPSPSPAQDCPSVASANGAGKYGKNLNCGAGGGETAKGKGRTDFVPHDDSPPPPPNKRRLLMGRQDSPSRISNYQSALGIIESHQLSSLTGGIINTFASVNGTQQVVLSQGERGSVFSGEHAVRRSLSSRALCNTSSTPLELYSGFGNKVTIIKANIPYDGGIIHITDGWVYSLTYAPLTNQDSFFTIPETLSETLASTVSTSRFSSFLASSNNTRDSAPSITVFAPNDAAFLAGFNSNTTLSPGQVGSFLNAHVIEGFAAYSPLLVSGASYKTASGARVNISTTREGIPILNGNAAVVGPDIVIANGVVHVIDQVRNFPRAFYNAS
jgi:uncharacterized surface protein with fasciclin (FAS1) repeats